MSGQRPYSSQPGDDLDYIDWPASINSVGKPRHERRKPMIRIVCPICAAMIMVNALDVAGATDSRCSKCQDTVITIETDDDARIIGIVGYDNTEGKTAKAKKPPDWRIFAGVGAALVALMLFVLMLNAARQNETGRTAPNNLRNETGLASPVKSAAPVPSIKAAQTPPDMFAPERK